LAAYRWDPTATPAAELRRIARAQVDRAIAELDLDDPDEAVHQIRKRTKKLRALLRLVRPVVTELYRAENRTVRDLARELSGARDDAASVGALGGLADEAGDRLPAATVATVRDGLTGAGGDVTDPSVALERARLELVELRSRIERDWRLPKRVDGADAVVPGFRRSYAQGRDAFEELLDDPTTAALHEWRKRVKDHWYHCRLLRPVWPSVMKARASALNELSELLGDDHDLAVLRASLQADPARFGGEVHAGTTSALLDRRRADLQRDAISLGRRVYADRPKAMERRILRWWEVALIDGGADAAVPLVEPGR
jgi:CHAD domain-containing protein